VEGISAHAFSIGKQLVFFNVAKEISASEHCDAI